MNELSLFSGAGGGLLGTHLLGWRAIGYVEFNDYCQRVIAQRIADGILPNAPIFGDVREFVQSGAAREYRGFTDVVTGGFPCQPFSVAGKRAGADDPRNMWPATIDTVRAVRPRYCFFENVPGLLNSGYFERILCDLTESGYSVRWRCLSASELGAPHKRDRLWIVAYADSPRQSRHTENHRRMAETGGVSAGNGTGSHSSGRTERTDMVRGKQHPIEDQPVDSADVAHTSSAGTRMDDRRAGRSSGQRRQPADASQPAMVRQEHGAHRAEGLNASGADVCNATSQGLSDGRSAQVGEPRTQPQFERPSWWEAEPPLGRVVDGYAGRVDELKALGNAQVASVAAAAWHLLTEDLQP